MISVTLVNADTQQKSPKQQLDEGISPENVLCNENLVLIFKPSDGSPTCVKESTMKKLISRGWTQTQFSIIFETDKQVYKLGESIEVLMKNIGSETLTTPSTSVGFSIYDDSDERVCTWNGVNLQIGLFAPGETLTEILDTQKGCHHIDKESIYKIKPGLYRLKADHFIEYGLWKNYHGPTYEITITSTLRELD